MEMEHISKITNEKKEARLKLANYKKCFKNTLISELINWIVAKVLWQILYLFKHPPISLKLTLDLSIYFFSGEVCQVEIKTFYHMFIIGYF